MTGDPMTDAYAVFGNPIAHSQSPRIHQAFAAQTGEAINYMRQLVELGEFSKAASAFIAAGTVAYLIHLGGATMIAVLLLSKSQ